MNLKFPVNIPKLRVSSENNRRTNFEPTANVDSSAETWLVVQQSKQNAFWGINLWGWSLLSLVPWAINTKEKISTPAAINKELKRRRSSQVEKHSGGGNPLRFRPYMSKVPWHTGARAFLSQLFPRYGYYCGPNWSSGKDRGSLLWDKRPMDWLDYCCYCHDIGYDTHDQAKLLEADMAFLECLERPRMTAKGDLHVAHIYKTMCITVALWATLDEFWLAKQREMEKLEFPESLKLFRVLRRTGAIPKFLELAGRDYPTVQQADSRGFHFH